MIDKMNKWLTSYSQFKHILEYKPVFWTNPNYSIDSMSYKDCGFSVSDLIDAEARYQRFAPFFVKAFPETGDRGGIIESDLTPLEDFRLGHKVYLKGDYALPISGSIKARGGIYEVIRHAEALLLKEDRLTIHDDYSVLLDDTYKSFFNQYKIIVSSTGNLGLSIGIISAKLGFNVEVHMSRDAMAWKKELLRSLGVNVIEYPEDYSQAVIYGRASAAKDPMAYFVDDESSVNLFLGYGVAALRLRKQLRQASIKVSKENPLIVYLPCGVGGGPGGIAWALKEVFQDKVHCVFVEPTHSPCMLLGMMTGEHDQIAVQDIGLDNMTIADGLAVGKPSAFVGHIMMDRLLGVATVSDEDLLEALKDLHKRYNVFLEPSALAGIQGLDMLMQGLSPLSQDQVKSATHVLWATGGKMVPDEVKEKYID